jgi:hypothetical protein
MAARTGAELTHGLPGPQNLRHPARRLGPGSCRDRAISSQQSPAPTEQVERYEELFWSHGWICGRPRGRRVEPRSNRDTRVLDSGGAAERAPAPEARRRPSSSARLSRRLTKAHQSGGHGRGHAVSSSRLAASPRFAPPQAAPASVLRPPHEPGAQRIALDIAAHGEQVLVRLYQKRLVAPLVEVPASGGAAAQATGQENRTRYFPLSEP